MHAPLRWHSKHTSSRSTGNRSHARPKHASQTQTEIWSSAPGAPSLSSGISTRPESLAHASQCSPPRQAHCTAVSSSLPRHEMHERCVRLPVVGRQCRLRVRTGTGGASAGASVPAPSSAAATASNNASRDAAADTSTSISSAFGSNSSRSCAAAKRACCSLMSAIAALARMRRKCLFILLK